MSHDECPRDPGVRRGRLRAGGPGRPRHPAVPAPHAMSAAPVSARRLRVLAVTGAYAPEISSGGLQAQMVARVLADRVAYHVLTTAVDPALPRRAIVDEVPVSR